MKYDIRVILKEAEHYLGEIERCFDFNKILEDRESLKETLKLSPRTYAVMLRYAKDKSELVNDEELAQIALENGFEYKDLITQNPGLIDNTNLAHTAVKMDGMNIEYLNVDNAKNTDIIIDACLQNPDARNYIKNEELKNYLTDEKLDQIKEIRNEKSNSEYDNKLGIENEKQDETSTSSVEENRETFSDLNDILDLQSKLLNVVAQNKKIIYMVCEQNKNLQQQVQQLKQELEALKTQNTSLEQSLTIESDGMTI